MDGLTSPIGFYAGVEVGLLHYPPPLYLQQKDSTGICKACQHAPLIERSVPFQKSPHPACVQRGSHSRIPFRDLSSRTE